jgi:crotonobetaine/carnitine-CoA ligase
MTYLHPRAEQRTIADLIELQAEAMPHKPLLRTEQRSQTYLEARDAGVAMAALLVDLGVRRGDRVAVMAENRPETLELWLGCSWIGAILVPINVSTRGAALAHVLADCDPRLLVVEHALLETVEHLNWQPASLTRILTYGSAPARHWRGIEVSDLPPRQAGATMPRANVRPGDASAILYTSGTTGPSKGVCCPQAQFFWWGTNTAAALRITSDDVLYTCLPLFHTNALNTFVQALVSGSTYVLGPRFSASRFWSRLVQADATVTYILGAMVSILARADPGPADTEHRVRIALAPATPPELVHSFRERFGVELVDGHGMTETNLVIGPRDGTARPGFMGKVMPTFAARVVDENDSPVAHGTPGELVMRADEPHAFATGYWRLPDATVTAWQNLWFHSGDRVVQEADGSFRFVDRIKDSIRRRGENISAWEVEQALLGHPNVAAAAAYAVPSELGEDEVMVTVVVRSGATVDPVELIRHCEPQLAYFAVPRYVAFADHLPTTENGKVQKFALRERGVDDETWDREEAGYELRR